MVESSEPDKLYYTMSRRERKEQNKEKQDQEGGFHVDNRWAKEEDTAQRVQFLKNLSLSAFAPLEEMTQRVDCPKCRKSCKYYCCNCIIPVTKSPIPKLKLPLQVTVISHPKEKTSKSSILPAKLVAPDDVEILCTTEVPVLRDNDNYDEVVLLFPGDSAKQVTDLTIEELKAIKKVVLIDSTWSQTRMYMNDENLSKLKMVKIQTEKTVFWRYQTGEQDTSLATIEALYFFMRDFEVGLNCNGNYARYNKRYDDFLWFYAYNYHLIQKEYTDGKYKGKDFAHIPGYIQSEGKRVQQEGEILTVALSSKLSQDKQESPKKSVKQESPKKQQLSKIEEWLGNEIYLKKKKVTTGDLIANKPKLVMLYFSMHTCPPCRKFTPLLSMLYQESNEDECKFEVVFFSGDGTQEMFDHYYEEMPWFAIPWKDARIKVVAKEFKVKGLPQLIVLKPSGELICSNGVDLVTKNGPMQIEEWIEQC